MHTMTRKEVLQRLWERKGSCSCQKKRKIVDEEGMGEKTGIIQSNCKRERERERERKL